MSDISPDPDGIAVPGDEPMSVPEVEGPRARWKKVAGLATWTVAVAAAAVAATLAVTHNTTIAENAKAYVNGLSDGLNANMSSYLNGFGDGLDASDDSDDWDDY